MHCSDEPHLPSSMRCRTTHTSSSRCQALEVSSRSMETPNALSEHRSTWRPSRRKYKVASQGNSPVWLLNVRTPSSAPGVTYSKTAWHVPSKHSSAAPTPALAKLRNQYYAYIITLWKYHGHKGRGTTTACPECGSTALGAPDFVISLFLFLGLHFQEGLFGSTIAEHKMQQQGRQQATSNVQVVSITS